MRGLSRSQLDHIDILRNSSPTLISYAPAVLEKEVIVKDVVLEVIKVGRDAGFELIFSGGALLAYIRRCGFSGGISRVSVEKLQIQGIVTPESGIRTGFA